MALQLHQTQNLDKYFDGDWDALQDYQRDAARIKSMSKKDFSLDLHLYPEPFAGNPDAPVYILNGNPGLDARDRIIMQRDGWSDMMEKSYNPTEGSTMYWLDEQWESKIFTPTELNSPGTYRSGFRWWLGNKDRTQANSKWKSGIASELKNSYSTLHEKVFNVEYFPYHSKSLNMNLINKYIKARADDPDPNSVVKIVNNYLMNALDAGKVFIIMRCEKEWIERLNSLIRGSNKISSQQIPNKCRDLYNYGGKGIITLNCRQRVWLTQGNILEDPNKPHARWNLLCQTLGITPP